MQNGFYDISKIQTQEELIQFFRDAIIYDFNLEEGIINGDENIWLLNNRYNIYFL